MPFLLRLAAAVLRGAVAAAAVLLIFPEYRWSTRKALPPPLVAVLTGLFAAALSLDLVTPW